MTLFGSLLAGWPWKYEILRLNQVEVWDAIENVTLDIKYLDATGSLSQGYGSGSNFYPLRRTVVFTPVDLQGKYFLPLDAVSQWKQNLIQRLHEFLFVSFVASGVISTYRVKLENGTVLREIVMADAFNPLISGIDYNFSMVWHLWIEYQEFSIAFDFAG